MMIFNWLHTLRQLRKENKEMAKTIDDLNTANAQLRQEIVEAKTRAANAALNVDVEPQVNAVNDMIELAKAIAPAPTVAQ